MDKQLIQISPVSDPLPFTVAPSQQTESTISYTFTGSKTGGTQGFAMLMLGVPWSFGGGFMVYMFFLGTPSPGLGYFFGGGGLLISGIFLIWLGFRLMFKAKSKGELCVNIHDGQASFRASGIKTVEYSGASLIVCGLFEHEMKPIRYWCVSIQTELHWTVLGALTSIDNALEYAQVVSLETGLDIQNRTEDWMIETLFFEQMIKSDKRALKKPISTKPIRPIKKQ